MSNDTPKTIEIILTKGYVAIVDECDADLAMYKWRAGNERDTVYAIREIGKRPDRKNELMHRVILERIINQPLLKGQEVDHIDGNCCNNKRSNLRLATHSQNSKNKKRYSNNTSGYKGVSRVRNRWSATISINHKQVRIGLYATPEEAYNAYCEAAKKYYGEFARLE